MSTTEPQRVAPKPKLRWYQFSLRSLLLATTLLCAVLSLFAWQVKRAARQGRCIQAIRDRGGRVYYDYNLANGQFDPEGKSQVPQWLLGRLGVDFFHRVARVDLVELEPLAWEQREQERFSKGLWSDKGEMSAEDCAALAMHELHYCGGDSVEVWYHGALQRDPHCTEANLILGTRLLERRDDLTQARPYLEAALRDSSPESLEYAHAQKLLAGEQWTFDELCRRVGPDGALK